MIKKIVTIAIALVLASCGNTGDNKQPSEKPMKTYFPNSTPKASD